MDNIEDKPYNSSVIAASLAGQAISKVSYTPVTEVEYDVLRRLATVKCLDAKAKKNPCDPASKCPPLITFFQAIDTEFFRGKISASRKPKYGE